MTKLLLGNYNSCDIYFDEKARTLRLETVPAEQASQQIHSRQCARRILINMINPLVALRRGNKRRSRPDICE